MSAQGPPVRWMNLYEAEEHFGIEADDLRLMLLAREHTSFEARRIGNAIINVYREDELREAVAANAAQRLGYNTRIKVFDPDDEE